MAVFPEPDALFCRRLGTSSRRAACTHCALPAAVANGASLHRYLIASHQTLAAGIVPSTWTIASSSYTTCGYTLHNLPSPIAVPSFSHFVLTPSAYHTSTCDSRTRTRHLH